MRHTLGLIAITALLTTASTTIEGRAGEWAVPAHSLQADRVRIEAMPLCTLGDYYMSCERRALSRRLAPKDVPACSLAYEILKRKAFAGDWRRLHAWTTRTLLPRPNFIMTGEDDPFSCDAPA